MVSSILIEKQCQLIFKNVLGKYKLTNSKVIYVNKYIVRGSRRLFVETYFGENGK